MSRKRKKYRSRDVLSDPLAFLRPASEEKRAEVMLLFLTALDAMASGTKPGEQEWRSLSDSINTIETLVQQGKLPAAETMPLVDAACEAMVSAAARHRAGLRMGFSGSGLQAVRDVVTVYDQCMTVLTEHEMAMAQQETQRRVNEILRAKQSDEVVMI